MSLFDLERLIRINVAQEPWRGHAHNGLGRNKWHYSSFVSIQLSAGYVPSRPRTTPSTPADKYVKETVSYCKDCSRDANGEHLAIRPATVTYLKFRVFWDVAPWTDVSEVRTTSIIRIHRPFDGGSTHLWNVGPLQRDYTMLHPRRL
jgi:hypothetical protein